MRNFTYIRLFEEITLKDISLVGGKNSSLGEMFNYLKKDHIPIPQGFSTTSQCYFHYLQYNSLEEPIKFTLKSLKEKKLSLKDAGAKIRELFLKGKIPDDVKEELLSAYLELSNKYKKKNIEVAVRSSATAEDLPSASFAGQHESYLNVSGEKDLLEAFKKCLSSLFTDRAIVYREEKGFDHLKIGLCVGIQKMVRSDLASAGVIFTLDPESGFPKVVSITAAFGFGENVVQGTIIPDEYQVFKDFLDQNKLNPIIEMNLGRKEKKMILKNGIPKNISTPIKEQKSFVLEKKEILALARMAKKIEDHYGYPLDIEWAKDGKENKLYIVQARAVTVKASLKKLPINIYRLKEKGKKILSGTAIGEAITSGKVQVILNTKDLKKFKKGSILVTTMTSPDWVPIMKDAAGIITDHGGRTSHAAIVSRELGIPAIVGTKNATQLLKDNQEITLSCAEGEIGNIYEGMLGFTQEKQDFEKIKKAKTPLMINVSSPTAAFHWWQLPVDGIGLARMEFIISNMIRIHPMALLYPEKVSKKEEKIIHELTSSYPSRKEYFVDILSRSIAKIAASQYPKSVIVRTSDFKTNEYASLIGGSNFEIKEENPMIGFRGACRYYSPQYKEGFALECLAIKRAREAMGFKNIKIMIPFCRTIDEAKKVLLELKKNGLVAKKSELEIYVMAEIPSNIILAEEFCKLFDGFSIGSNDLTQLTLGIDRDEETLSELFDPSDLAIKRSIEDLIIKAHKHKNHVGICGQAPSDNPKFASFLIEKKIDSISLNPDSVISLLKYLENHN